MAKNKVRFGLKNVHYAVLTETEDDSGNLTYSWGTPKAWPGAVALSVSPEGDTTDEYADDGIWVTLDSNQGYTGSLETEIIPNDFREEVLGETVGDDGVVTENANVNPKPFALLCEAQGDQTNRRYCFFHTTCQRPGLESNTKQGTPAPDHESIDVTIRPLSDGRVRSYVDSDGSAYSTWFDKVYAPETTTT